MSYSASVTASFGSDRSEMRIDATGSVGRCSVAICQSGWRKSRPELRYRLGVDDSLMPFSSRPAKVMRCEAASLLTSMATSPSMVCASR